MVVGGGRGSKRRRQRGRRVDKIERVVETNKMRTHTDTHTHTHTFTNTHTQTH